MALHGALSSHNRALELRRAGPHNRQLARSWARRWQMAWPEATLSAGPKQQPDTSTSTSRRAGPFTAHPRPIHGPHTFHGCRPCSTPAARANSRTSHSGQSAQVGASRRDKKHNCCLAACVLPGGSSIPGENPAVQKRLRSAEEQGTVIWSIAVLSDRPLQGIGVLLSRCCLCFPVSIPAVHWVQTSSYVGEIAPFFFSPFFSLSFFPFSFLSVSLFRLLFSPFSPHTPTQ